jgi:hypothetical protein
MAPRRAGYRAVMTHRDDHIEIEDLPAEEGVSEEDAKDRLDRAPEDQANFTETHPAEARHNRQVMREGGTTDGEVDGATGP